MNGYDAIVGLLTPGVFLAHIVNIYTNRFDRPVWIFRIYPFVAIQPGHYHASSNSQESGQQSILICDESVKTGFSISVFETYSERYRPKAKATYVYTIIDFTSYERIPDLQSYMYGLLKESRDGRILINPEFARVLGKGVDPIGCDYDKHLSCTESLDCMQFDGRLDLSIMLTHTPTFLLICRRFVSKIAAIVEERNSKVVLLYAPSAEGKVLALMTAFLLKHSGKEVGLTPVKWRDWKKSDSIRISIDLAENTGFTLARNLSSLLGVPLVKNSNEKSHNFSEIALSGNRNTIDQFFDLRLNALDECRPVCNVENSNAANRVQG